jgi:hypothetical protein
MLPPTRQEEVCEVVFDGTSPFDLVTYDLELGLIPTLPLVFQPVSG